MGKTLCTLALFLLPCHAYAQRVSAGPGPQPKSLSTSIVFAPDADPVHVLCDAGTCGGASAFLDRSTFVFGSTAINVFAGVFDDTPPAVLTTGQSGAARMTAYRAVHFNLRDSSGNELGLSAAPMFVNCVNCGGGSTPVLMADATANPTLSQLAVFPMLYNGTTWDRARGDTTAGAWVNVKNASLAVTGTFWQATQPVSIASTVTVDVTDRAGRALGSIANTGFNVNNFPATQPVSIADGSSVTLGARTDAKSTATDATSVSAMQVLKEMSAMLQAPASTPVTGTFWQATQPVSGTFWQATQPVSGTFWQTTQPVSLAAAVDVSDRAARLLGVVYGSQGQQLKQTATNFNAQVELATGATLYDARQTRALTSADVVTANQGTPANWAMNEAQVAGVATSVGFGLSDTGTQRVVLPQEATYAAGTTTKTATTAGTGPFFSICGSGTKTIRVQRVAIAATVATTAVWGDLVLKKTSTATSGGTATALTRAPHDSNSAAATATVNFYTALATAGTSVGNILTVMGLVPVTVLSAPPSTIPIFQLLYTWRDLDAEVPVLRGTAQCLEANFGTTTTNAPTLTVSVEWTEK